MTAADFGMHVSRTPAARARRYRLIGYGRWQPYVAAGPAREHLARLSEQGVGLPQVARVSGLPHGTLSRLVHGSRGRPPSRRIRPETEAAILAVTAADRADGARVDATPTWRRVHSLIALGYTRAWIGQQIGQGSGALRLGERLVTVRQERAVKALYDRVGDTPAPPSPASIRSRREAERRGWLPPICWDDDERDARAEFRTAVLTLAGRGVGVNEIGRRLGVPHQAVSWVLRFPKRAGNG